MKKDKSTEELEQKVKELEEGWKRTQADFENFRKRMEAQKLEILETANANLMLEIVPVLDNFRRAFDHAPENDQWVLGMKQIEKQLEEILTLAGLSKIKTKNEIFNPNLHEAISYEENELPADTIIAEAESGWQFKDKVLKPAKVRVSKGK